jgi:pyruvate dehydrogenase E1 component alpha subunit
MNSNKKAVAAFEIFYYQYLNEKGEAIGELPEDIAKQPELWQKFYRNLVLNRLYDETAVKLQRTGKLGTYPPTVGQEAIGVGMGMAMHKDDIFVPYYREPGAHLTRGVLIEELYSFWGGDERGNNFAKDTLDLPDCIPIGTQSLHGAGIAMAMKLRGEKRAVVVSIGDGGTSQGNFYEAINFAGVHQLPLIFVINNNHWAISVPTELQTHAQTFAQKGIAAGVPGEQIDGNDIFAVYHHVRKAVEAAHAGQGPYIIEAITYRMCDHTTADDATRYCPSEEVAANKDKDPIKRLRTFMAAQGVWDEAKEKALYTKIREEVDKAVQNYLNISPAPVTDIFDYMYETWPESYHEQRDEVIAYHGGEV